MTGPRGLAKGDTGQDHLAWGVSWAPAEGGRYVRSRESWSGQNPESSTHRNPHRRWGCWAQRREGLTWGQVPAQPELGLWAPGRHPYSSASNCLPQKGWQTSLGPGSLGGNADGAADDDAPPSPPGALLTFWGPSWPGSSGASSPISRGCRNLRTKLRSWWKAWKAS